MQISLSLRHRLEGAGTKVLLLAALVSVITAFGIVAVLIKESWGFFAKVPLTEFLFGLRWEPLLEPKSFGVLPLVGGTLIILVGACLVAIPAGLGSAVYLSEYASKRSRAFLKPTLEVLAGIPTVVYGYFALTFVTPLMKGIIPETEVFNAASAAFVVGIMILPMVASLCDDAIRAVPVFVRDGGLAMGATSFEVITQLMIPMAWPRILAAVLLACSRAIGETMAVTLAAGATPNLTWNPLESVQTMTAYIVQVSLGDTPADGIEYQSCFAVAALLFVMTLFANIIAQRVVNRSKAAEL